MRRILTTLLTVLAAGCGNVLPQPSIKETIDQGKALSAKWDQDCRLLGYLPNTADYQQCISISQQRYSYDEALRGVQTQGAVSAGAAMLPMLFMFSDIRLKTNIAEVGHLGSGLGLYRFNYIWDSQPYVGVLAQEVTAIRPDAVISGPDGFLRVNYSKIGMRLMTLEEWTADQR